MPTLKVRLICEVDGEVVYDNELGSDLVSQMTGSIPEIEENADLFGYLALSPSFEVRKAIAYKDHLKEETIALLAADSSVEVLRNLCNREGFKHWASEEILLKLIKHDVECARNIASSVSDFSNIEVNRVTVELCKHPDPTVRLRLADSYHTPKVVVKRLTQDLDPGVRAAAKKNLEQQLVARTSQSGGTRLTASQSGIHLLRPWSELLLDVAGGDEKSTAQRSAEFED